MAKAGVEDLVEPDVHQEHDGGVLQCKMSAAQTDSGWLSRTTSLPIGERRNGICVRSRKARTSSSARDQAMPLPTRTSGRSASYLLYFAEDGVRDCPGEEGCGRSAGAQGQCTSDRPDGARNSLRYEPGKTSRNRIKRLRGLQRPQYRLRIAEARVFYDISGSMVVILAIVTKSEAEAWLGRFGDPV
jgi:hypothetical protein